MLAGRLQFLRMPDNQLWCVGIVGGLPEPVLSDESDHLMCIGLFQLDHGLQGPEVCLALRDPCGG